MALDWRIGSQIKTPNMMDVYDNNLTRIETKQKRDEFQDNRPFRDQLTQQKLDINDQVLEQGKGNLSDSRNKRRLTDLYQFASQAKPYFGSPEGIEQLKGITQQRIAALDADPNKDSTESRQFLDALNSDPALAQRMVDQTIQVGGRQHGQKNVANSKMFPNGTSVSIRRDGSKVVTDASGNILTGEAAQVAVDAGIESDIALSGGKAGASSQASSDVELVMEPQVESAVGEVKNEVAMDLEEKKLTFAEKKQQKINDTVFKTYELAIGNVAKTLNLAPTGYFAGLLPAITNAQRTADGAGSIILPILKSMFREAGEGVFTDKDQEVLEGMMPTRQDNPEVSKVKLEMMDQVIRSKLNQSLSTPDSYSKEDKAILDKYGVTPE